MPHSWRGGEVCVPVIVNTSYNAEEADDDCECLQAMQLTRRRRRPQSQLQAWKPRGVAPLCGSGGGGGGGGGVGVRGSSEHGAEKKEVGEGEQEEEEGGEEGVEKEGEEAVQWLWKDEPNPFRSERGQPSQHDGELIYENHSWMCFA
jgi:hypothetical protein